MIKYFSIFFCLCISCSISSQSPVLPEHPNPIKYRANWENLNGEWDFAFDSLSQHIDSSYLKEYSLFNKKINVPFPWGSPLSAVDDEADIAWYKKDIRVNSNWNGDRIFLIIGASDWETHVWLDGVLLGSHQGGYVPFEFEITDYITYGIDQNLVIRVDDKRRDHTLYGKQGYGNARGIWQTVYLEKRGKNYIKDIHVTPDIDSNRVTVTAYRDSSSLENETADIFINTNNGDLLSKLEFLKGEEKSSAIISIPNQKLWTLDDPYLYGISIKYNNDILESYFGMRKISVMNLPGTDIPYIALNNKPIYLQMALDQSYHPNGYYTFPSDKFIIEEIKRSKSIGLNGIRTHIKVEVPRKLYWADRLGLLVMEDLPNSWGEPKELMQAESTYTLREMIRRDYNHPSIFSWVLMNETWGLFTDTEHGKKYLPETQKWVESLYHYAKSLDNSRLIEDNSICCGRGHTVTDINSWHVYLPGYEWDEYLTNLSDSTFQGSSFNYENSYVQGTEPNFNSECGNVWGYNGSTGDVDWSWDYHRMINSFRTHPKVGGWLYTEHHDVINEWNGYWRFDRSNKYPGFEDIVPGMTLNDLHSPIYISTGQNICYTQNAGEKISIPLFLSAMTDTEYPNGLELYYEVSHINNLGQKDRKYDSGKRAVGYKPWLQTDISPLEIQLPSTNGISEIDLLLKDKSGQIVHRNFVHVITENGIDVQKMKSIAVLPDSYSEAKWSKKVWSVMDGKKVNGAGNGYFEYSIPIDPRDIKDFDEIYFLIELSAKELFVKDMTEYDSNQDFMRGSKVAPSSNPNSYPMTDDTKFQSNIRVTANGEVVTHAILPDDPADHRGVLSWHSQKEDRTLHEAGSYGYYIKTAFNEKVVEKIRRDGSLIIRFESINEGGIAIYGKDFGRYPFDPTLIIKK